MGLGANAGYVAYACALRLMARTGHAGAVRRRLLLRVERTYRASEPPSDFDPNRKSALDNGALVEAKIGTEMNSL